MKTILIPTDFSANAWNTISFAMKFLKAERCTFYFLHTYTPAFYRMDYVLGGPEFSAIPDKGVDASISGLEKSLAAVKEQFGNPKHIYETVSAFNVLTDEINELIEKKSIDLIIMGTQGASGAKEIFWGPIQFMLLERPKHPFWPSLLVINISALGKFYLLRIIGQNTIEMNFTRPLK